MKCQFGKLKCKIFHDDSHIHKYNIEEKKRVVDSTGSSLLNKTALLTRTYFEIQCPLISFSVFFIIQDQWDVELKVNLLFKTKFLRRSGRQLRQLRQRKNPILFSNISS